ncbi:cell wall-binding protein [Clostridium chromiireducens]|uniref:Cell wall-binding protein n=1 Tax=Clostridium chromiireducens TaxID=225345 RepID=A0A964W134_9CLOT|nr:cell wall-binding protein [Clostridium chromiireducens]MVX62633.1 cell wall-binding protein [Clostridium chromiireducens]
MYRISRKFICLILLAAVITASCVSTNAYALWEKDNYQWKYIGDYGYVTGWQEIDNKWYYFNPEDGTMKRGWFYDTQYNKWYYLSADGDMVHSKITSNYPQELNNIYAKIKQYVNDEITYKWTTNIDGNIFICFISKNNGGARQFYYHVLTGNVYEMKNGNLTNLATHEVFNIFTEEQAVQVIKDYLSKSYKPIPQIIKVDSDDGESYLVHCYDDKGYYYESNSWYYVNKTTREVIPMI